MYDLAAQNEAQYLDWFHDVHIPEKLARPGYNWAAHYELISPEGQPVLLNGSDATAGVRGFIAIFGGDDSRTFLNPSPAQIKPNQTPLTREMMGMRIGSQSLIAAQEWRVESEAVAEPGYAIMGVDVCDTGSDDEDYGAWSVQVLCPRLSSAPGFEVLVKFLSTTSAAKHVTVSSFQTLADAQAYRANGEDDEWSARVRAYQVHSTGTPLLGRRIWPAG